MLGIEIVILIRLVQRCCVGLLEFKMVRSLERHVAWVVIA